MDMGRRLWWVAAGGGLWLAVLCMAGAAAERAAGPNGAARGDRANKTHAGAADGQAAKNGQGAGWQSLFDGKTLGRWKVIDQYDFADHGRVEVRDGVLVLRRGKPATGVRWTGPFPTIDFEVALEAKRVEGDDFFCAVSFHWNQSPMTLVLGGWDGTVVGLSSIDGEPAVENETCCCVDFRRDRWYRVRLRVTQPRIEVWLDERKIIDLATEGRRFSIYWEMEPCLPFGLATWYTTGAVRNIRLRKLGGP